MSDYATHYRLIRAIGAVVVLVPAILIVLLFFNDEPRQTRAVTATVLESPSAGGSAGTLPVVLVRLESGAEVRLYAGNRAISPGETVTLLETRYDDGERRFRLLSDRERMTGN
ncbi:hypothetical protein [Guyparkeria sp.]|uniref:hypothetical protein n=1 Tax=Guyparkeria sp. TaxID=2035736 RepID=UPI003568E5F5